MNILQFANALHGTSLEWAINLLVLRDGTAFVAVDEQVSTSPVSSGVIELAAHASTWWLQNPTKPYEAITTAVCHS